MIRLDVWLTHPSGGSIKAGTLVAADPDPVRGGLQGQFRYAPEYLEHPQAFPLDPLHLPLAADTFNADRPRAGVHGVFEDSLPDDWGRRLMAEGGTRATLATPSRTHPARQSHQDQRRAPAPCKALATSATGEENACCGRGHSRSRPGSQSPRQVRRPHQTSSGMVPPSR